MTVSLKRDVEGVLNGDQLSLSLQLLFEKNYFAAELKLNLSNDKDVEARKPLPGGGHKVVVLKVTTYDLRPGRSRSRVSGGSTRRRRRDPPRRGSSIRPFETLPLTTRTRGWPSVWTRSCRLA